MSFMQLKPLLSLSSSGMFSPGTYFRLSILSCGVLLAACQPDTKVMPNQVQSHEVKTSVANAENNDLNCPLPAIADYADLSSAQTTLPDPFLSVDGKRITDKTEWPCRRAEIKAQAQAYMLGNKPADTVNSAVKVSGVYQQDQLQVTVKQADKSLNFAAEIILPTTGTAPYPAMIGIGRVYLNNEALLKQGIAIINFPNNDIAEQKDGSSRGKGKFYDFYGSEHSAGALMAWAWGVSRLIDALQQTPDSPINASKLAVTGCSRNGKGALVTGAFDQRIALTIPQESGAGGSANWRISDRQLAAGTNVQTVRQIVTENVWFTEDFKNFSESVNLLPFDQHEILALVAPRGLLVIDNAIDWLGIESSYQNALAAKTVWQALDVPDNMGISQTQYHQHCQQLESQQAAINAFVQKFLLDAKDTDTKVQLNENGVSEDMSQWISWSTPLLK